MKMDLRLLENQRRTLWRVVAERQNGKNLRDTEADICNEYVRSLRTDANPNLE
jgi:hypothetical protein